MPIVRHRQAPARRPSSCILPARRMSTQVPQGGRILELEDTRKLYQSKTTKELIFAFAILKFCSYESLVRLSTRVFEAVQRTPLERPVLELVRPTFYKQFCSGGSIAESKPVLERLTKDKISTILEYVSASQLAMHILLILPVFFNFSDVLLICVGLLRIAFFFFNSCVQLCSGE